MLTNKESLDQIIVATPGLKSDAVALGKSTWFLLGLWNVMRWGFSHNARIKSFVSSRLARVFAGVLQDKDLFVQFADPSMLDM